MTHTMGRGPKRTLGDFNFGKRTAAQSRKREKQQMNVVVRRSLKAKATWLVSVTHKDVAFDPGYLTALLPGEFKTMVDANDVARTLAWAYRRAGYNVALKTANRRSQHRG